MNSFLTTLYFAYFRQKQKTEHFRMENSQPKAAGQIDVTQIQFDTALEYEAELKQLVTEYTLILKGGNNV